MKDVTKTYKNGQVEIKALDKINLVIEEREFVSIMGPSGSGKSTLLNIIGCLDKPTTGTYELFNINIGKTSDWKLSDVRNQQIGFVFQQFHLLPNLNALENVELPLIYRGILGKERKHRAIEALKAVGLEDRMKHFPSQLSGGEQQRVAIARALVGKPSLILADESTGALDSSTGEKIMSIFNRINKELGVTIVQVTHEYNIAKYGRRIFHLLDGRIERVELTNVTETT